MKETEIETTNTYPEPSPELIADIRKRLTDANIPQDVLERAHHTLMHDTIDAAGRLLYRAGLCLCSAELYEYRKTLFPPNSLLDPLTAGPPVLRNQDTAERGVPAEPLADRSADSLSASAIQNPKSEIQNPVTPLNPEPQTLNAELSESLNPQRSTLNSSGASLLSDLRSLLNRYVVLPEMAAETLALWVVHTYAFTLRQVTTYIGVVSPEKRCGKTTLLELLGRLANRSLTAANISPSAMFRVIEQSQPTLLIDEADTFLEGRDELAGILNAGYRKGNSYVVRVADRKSHRTHPGGTSYTSPTNGECANDGHTNPGGTSYTSPHPASPHSNPAPEFAEWTNDPPASSTQPSTNPTQLVRYSCWCPKVMAAIGRLPDTLADRCIVITMQRKMAGEKCERMRHLNAEDLRKRCAEFVRTHSDQIAHAQPEIPSTLNDRAADIWEPLLAIADLAGGDWPELARQAAQQLSASDDEMTLVGYFLKDLRNYMVLGKVNRLLSREIVAAFNPMHSRPWEDLRRGREINEWWLGWQMRELGIRTKTMRVGDVQGRGYLLEEIDAAFRRYVPNAEMHCAQPPAPEIRNNAEPQGAKDAEEQDSAGAGSKVEAQIDKLIEQLMIKTKEDKT